MSCDSCKPETYVVYINNNHKKLCPECFEMKEAIKKLRLDEGERLKLYQCSANKWTIGIGHNLSDRGISKAVMELMFSEDLSECLDDLPQIFPAWDNFSVPRQGAFLNMRFQLGYGRFRNFKKMIAAANSKDWKEVIVQAKDSAWFRQMRAAGSPRAFDVIDQLKRG